MKNTEKINKRNQKIEVKKDSPTDISQKKASKPEQKSKQIGSLKEMKDKIFQKMEIIPDAEDHNPVVKDVEEIHEMPELKQESKVVVEAPKDLKDEEFSDQKNRVEAILFASGKYLSEDAISELCAMDKRTTRKALEGLKKDYESKENSLMVFEDNKNWKINVREKYLSLVRKIVADTEFSKSIMETLAVIAWKTPMSQSEVIKIRGNKAYDHVASLEDSGFVSKIKKGRSYILKTTDKFYIYFDIDQKNLKGVMEEVKIPEKQATLEEAPLPKTIDKETMMKNIENISVKRIVETDEDKLRNKEFLEQIEGKIREVSDRTATYDEDLPKPMHMQEQHAELADQTSDNELPDQSGNEITNSMTTNEVTNQMSSNELSDQTSTNEISPNINNATALEASNKPKILTRKQLEKKFKDDLLRVREKMQK